MFLTKMLSVGMLGLFMAVLPSSSSYQLNNYGFGSGGADNSSSTNYRLNATTGETSNTQSTSATYSARSGRNNVQQANVPAAPTLTNGANYYDRLQFIVTPGASPTDTKYTIAISTDNFTTTQYIQADDTIGASKVYQTYASWGGSSGQYVIGLSQSTTYKIKVNAMQGNFTETEYGPTASASTVAPTISFDIDVASTNIDTSPPYAAAFGNLLPATVTNTTELVWVDTDTNGNSGMKVYVKSANAGLKSNSASFTLTSATADLSVASTGYGAQGSSATQTSGGPLTISAPYNVAAQNVGILDTSAREIFSASAPITAGRGAFQLKAKAAAQTPASADYQDTLTLTAAAIF